jgi:hypothetical protein
VVISKANHSNMEEERLKILQSETIACLLQISENVCNLIDGILVDGKDHFGRIFMSAVEENQSTANQLFQRIGSDVSIADHSAVMDKPKNVAGHFIWLATRDLNQLKQFRVCGGDVEANLSDIIQIVESLRTEDGWVTDFAMEFAAVVLGVRNKVD